MAVLALLASPSAPRQNEAWAEEVNALAAYTDRVTLALCTAHVPQSSPSHSSYASTSSAPPLATAHQIQIQDLQEFKDIQYFRDFQDFVTFRDMTTCLATPAEGPEDVRETRAIAEVESRSARARRSARSASRLEG
jgi:hypothetical protein